MTDSNELPKLEHTLSLPVLGIDTRFETNSEAVVEMVEQSFGRWRELPASQRTEHTPVRVRIAVIDGSVPKGTHSITYVSGPDHRLALRSDACVAEVDPPRRESIARVSAEAIQDREQFRVGILEAITFALLAAFDRHPLHAAAITRGDRTALLAGAGGSGKSTLAYLAYSAGLDVLSDDHVWIQLEQGCRIWGSAPHARLRSEAAVHFPEIDHPGADKLAVHLAPRDAGHQLVARGPVVCILARGDAASLTPLTTSEIESELISQLSPGFDRFPERNHAAFRRIAQSGGWRLTLSNDPRDSLPLLRRVLDGT